MKSNCETTHTGENSAEYILPLRSVTENSTNLGTTSRRGSGNDFGSVGTDETSDPGQSADNTKEKKSKKEKKHKKEKKKKKKKKAEERLQNGMLEGRLEDDFDAFITAKESMMFAPQHRVQGLRRETAADANGWESFHLDMSNSEEHTPRTHSTSTTMNSSASYDGKIQQMLPPNNEDSPNEDGRDLSQLNGDMLKTYLTSQGQDEKLAVATAIAFENFLKQHELHSDSASKVTDSSKAGASHSRAGSSHYASSHVSSNDEEDDNEDLEDEDYEDDEEYTVEHDFSDVSTLGWSAADDFGNNSWANGTFMSHEKSGASRGPIAANAEPFGEVRRNQDFVGSTRRVPNRVAAAQVKVVASFAPSRFLVNPDQERTYEQQMASLSIDDRNVVMALKSSWLKSGRPPFPNSWYLRFARCSPGRPFTFSTAYKSMKAFDQRYMNLTIRVMEDQIRTMMLFPVPGLRSINGHSMFYMRPSRYFPKQMSVSSVINNLVYVLSCMTSKEMGQRDGIGFVANMTDWTMSNFQVNYCYKFMMGLQGKKTPARVQLFLIVNPPSWFGSIWKIMKPMLSTEFRRKVHMIKFAQMKDFLAPGFEEFLPDDIVSGQQDTASIVDEFILERKSVEAGKHAYEVP